MAAYMRLGDRTFFIYDHSITKKEEDDPTDAIIYFFPQNTSIDIQCIFCNQLMGMVNCTKTIAGAPPKLYKLRRTKIATIHEGNFTLALACKLRTPDSAIIRKLENLYRVFAFYHGSIASVQQISNNNEAFLSNMASIWNFYVPYVRRYGNAVPAMFEPIQNVKLLKGGNFLFLRCSHLLQWLKGQPSLLAGCILYKRSVLCTQLTPELTSHLVLIKPNQLHHPSKSVSDTVLPFGVRILSVYVTEQQYKQLCKPLQPVSKPRRSAQAKQPDIFYTPPTTPTEKKNAESQLPTSTQPTTRKKREKKRSLTAGKLFSNFTGMLEGTVVESLWPSTSKSGTPCSRSEWKNGKRERLMHGSPGSMKGGEDDEVVLSRSSDDVVKTLQGHEGSPGKDLPGIAHSTYSKDIDDGSDYSPRSLNYHNSSVTSQISQGSKTDELMVALSGAQPVTNTQDALGSQTETDQGFAETDLLNTMCPDDRLEILVGDAKLTSSVLAMETREDERHEQESEYEVNDVSAIVRDSSTDCDQRKDLKTALMIESPLKETSKAVNAFPILSEDNNESPESGIGDCAMQRRNEYFNGINESLGEKVNGFEDVVENGPVGRYNAVEVISVGDRPLADSKDGLSHGITLCEDGRSENETVLLTGGEATSPMNATCEDSPRDANTNEVLMNGPDITYAKEDSSVLKSRDTDVNATQTSPRPHSVGKDKDTDTSIETNASHLFEGSVVPLEIEETSETQSKDCSFVSTNLKASDFKPDVLKSSAGEQRDDPDLLDSSKMNHHETNDSRNGDSVKDINSNVNYGESEKLTKLCSESEIEDVVGEVGERETSEEVGLSDIEEDEEDEEERTFVDDDEGNDIELIGGQDTDATLYEESTESSDTVVSVGKLQNTADAERQELHSNESTRRDTSQDDLTSVKEPNDINVQSFEGRPSSEDKCKTFVSKEELYEGRQEETRDTFDGDKAERRPTLETNSFAVSQDTEILPDLVNVSLYIQAHSDTTLLFLAEKSILKEKDSLFQLWQSVLRELGELELQLKNVVKPEQELDNKATYNFIHVDKRDQSLEGSISNPINQAESVFCRGCQLTHEQFLSDPTLTDITLRNQQLVVYAHQNACHHTFFHKSYKSNPSPGIPSRDDSGFYIQNSCKEAIKEHNINLV